MKMYNYARIKCRLDSIQNIENITPNFADVRTVNEQYISSLKPLEDIKRNILNKCLMQGHVLLFLNSNQ